MLSGIDRMGRLVTTSPRAMQSQRHFILVYTVSVSADEMGMRCER